MAEINVVIPAETGDPKKDIPLVFRFDTCVRPKEPIVWRVWSLNPKVRYVAIEFMAPSHQFFGRALSSGFFKLEGTPYDKSNSFLIMGETAIVGMAPPLGTRDECKYWVRCRYDESDPSGEINLDPKIIIDGP